METRTNSTTNTKDQICYSAKEYKKAIKEYINDCNARKEQIKNLQQIYDYLKLEKGFEFAKPTFYRFAKEVGCYKTSTGSYYIKESSSDIFLQTIIKPQKYNKTLTYILEEPSYGQIIAQQLNETYYNRTDSFYFVSIQNLLICFYYYKKNKNNSITSSEIDEIVKCGLERIYIHYE